MVKRQRRMAPDPLLEINPETAARLGINEGDWVYLETANTKGQWRITFKARLIPELDTRVVAGAHAWWFPEKPGPEHGCFDSNINAVLNHDGPYDPIVGIMQCRGILCRIGKAES